jgi:hypothetical protein
LLPGVNTVKEKAWLHFKMAAFDTRRTVPTLDQYFYCYVQNLSYYLFVLFHLKLVIIHNSFFFTLGPSSPRTSIPSPQSTDTAHVTTASDLTLASNNVRNSSRIFTAGE